VSKPRTFNRDLVYPVRKDATGTRLCRWDQKPVAPGRRSYCSKQCQIEVDIRTNAAILRGHIRRRDRGICAQCACDTKRIERVISFAAESFNDLMRGRWQAVRYGWQRQAIESLFISLGFNRDGAMWEADHIVEVSAGGDSNLENIQTLCVPCHKAKTKKMHADRKFERTGIRPKEPIQETQLTMI
jgi:5-methylcytosine-specific restriction enzyme A